jgi:hypothetical protein
MYCNWNGNSGYGPSAGHAIGPEDERWPPPPWKFGLRKSDDRGSI